MDSWKSSRIILNELRTNRWGVREGGKNAKHTQHTRTAFFKPKGFDVITQLVYNDDINEYCWLGIVYVCFVLGVPDAHTMLTLSRVLFFYCYGYCDFAVAMLFYAVRSIKSFFIVIVASFSAHFPFPSRPFEFTAFYNLLKIFWNSMRLCNRNWRACAFVIIMS